MIRATIKNSDIFRIKNEKLQKQLMGNVIKDTADKLVERLARNSPYDHGLLAAWAITELDEDHALIESPAEYAKFQNYGTTAHMIKPVEARALHWDKYYSRGHMVRGITGKHFVEKSIDEVKPMIGGFISRRLSEI